MTGLAGPRCRHPMKAYELSRYDGQPPELFPVCWRPEGHPGKRHASYAAYMRDLFRKRGYAHHARRAAGQVLAA